MELKPGYKQTEVGVIPEDWDVKRLRDISPSQSVGLVINPSSYFEANGEVPMLVGSCISENKINAEKASRISSKNSERLSACRLKAGDLVTVRVGFPGTTAVVPTELDGCNCASMMIIRRHKSFDSYWLAQLLNSPIGRVQIENVEYGTAQKQYNISDAIDFIFPVPPPAEQSKIAEAAKNFDEYIESLEQKIEKKRRIKQAAMQELLTGKRRLPGFEGEWVVKRLGDSALLKARIGWQGLTTAEYLSSGNYFLVTGTEFDSGYIAWNNCHFVDEKRYKQDKYIQLRPRDILVTKDGTIGKVALVTDLPGQATLNSGIFVIRPLDNAFNPEFFYYLLCSQVFSEFLGQLAAGSTINHLYQKDFVSFSYQKPPTIEEQAAIANILNGIDSELIALKTCLNKTRAIKQGMMQQLLTGKIRLR
jgi:type I restriction enzyme S subunit